MKKQITRLSPHQNAKVIGLVVAIATFPLILVMITFGYLTIPDVDQNGNPVQFSFPVVLVFLAPIFYFIFTYIGVVIACSVFNRIQKNVGGLEYECTDRSEVEPT